MYLRVNDNVYQVVCINLLQTQRKGYGNRSRRRALGCCRGYRTLFFSQLKTKYEYTHSLGSLVYLRSDKISYASLNKH